MLSNITSGRSSTFFVTSLSVLPFRSITQPHMCIRRGSSGSSPSIVGFIAHDSPFACTPNISCSFLQPCHTKPRFFSSVPPTKKKTKTRTKHVISASIITPPSVNSPVTWSKYLLPPTVFLVSYVTFPYFVHFFMGFLVPISQGGPLTLGDYAVVTNGLFMAAVGILFATLISVTISTLRQRLQDVRTLVHQELAMIRTISIVIRDPVIIRSLGDYTRFLIIETFERNNKKYNVRQTEISAEDVLFKVVKQVNDCRLRANIEDYIVTLISLRTKRRATVDTVFPLMHYVLLGFLALCIVISFVFECSSFAILADSAAVKTMYAGMTGCLCWTFNLVSDLNDPFAGEYSVSRIRVMDTVEKIRDQIDDISRDR